jgi:light-regulated signal transduction histidine kinase (bacteriophytochrome)
LEAANKELEAFSYSVSHDLRAPLRGIDGWSLALAEDYGSQFDERAREYLDRVRSEAQRMGLLIDDMLQLSRVARAEILLNTVDLSAIALTVVARLREAHPDRKMEFQVEPGLTASGDARLLEVALTNLIQNAVKFTSPRPEARIEVGRLEAADDCTIFVRDNGVGFDMAYAKKLFAAFQRLHKAQDFPGTGIGLAIVQRVIQRHGGRVWAEAKPGEGATFYFALKDSNGLQ